MSNHERESEAQLLQEVPLSSNHWCSIELLCDKTLSVAGSYASILSIALTLLAVLAALGAKTEAEKMAERFQSQEIQSKVIPECWQACEMVNALRREIIAGYSSQHEIIELQNKSLELESKLTRIKVLLGRNNQKTLSKKIEPHITILSEAINKKVNISSRSLSDIRKTITDLLEHLQDPSNKD